MSSIAVTINGESRNVAAMNIEALLSELNLSGRKLAIELNRELVPRERFSETRLSEGDCIEIVQFVGGG